MLNKSKIRLMARLALYDKKYGAVDRRKNNYFKWDYIYFRNFWTRLGVFFGCMIITLFYGLNKILIQETDVFSLDLRQEATKIAFFTILTLVVYTVIGTLVAGSEYKKSKKRLDAYFMMLEVLDDMDNYEDYEDEYEEDEEQGSYTAMPAARVLRTDESDDEPYGWLQRHERIDEPDFDESLSSPGSREGTFSHREDEEDERGINMLKRLKGVNGDGGSAGEADIHKGGDSGNL